MTRQELFDKVAAALIAQGKPSLDPGGMCQYRGLEGLACAAGHLIPDEEYQPAMEGKLASAACEISPTLNSVKYDVGKDFLDAIQTAHDGGGYLTYGVGGAVRYPKQFCESAADDQNWLENFKGRMRFLAEHYGLNDEAVR
jgi:hypothetical protein